MRLNYLSRCTPGLDCTAAACCRACNATELITNPDFVGTTGWNTGSNWQLSADGDIFAAPGPTAVTAVLSQQVWIRHPIHVDYGFRC
jgi:hypothetical protein